MIIQVLFDVAVLVGIAWFSFTRAEPALTAVGARPRARLLARAATVVALIAVLVHLVAVVAGTGEPGATWIRILGGLVWIVIVGLGYPRYAFLRDVTGSRPGR